MSPADERKPRRKKTRSDGHPSRSHRKSRSHEPTAPAPPPFSEEPATVEDLRKARLSYLETPAAERKGKMKYEYTKTVPAKVEVSSRISRASRSSTGVSKSRSGTRRTRRRKYHDASGEIHDNDEDDGGYEYVYAAHDRERRSKTTPNTPIIDQTLVESERTRRRSPAKAQRLPAERRHTLPVISQAVDEGDLPSSSRPQLRKSTTTTTLPTSTRPSLNRSATSKSRPQSEVSIARPAVTGPRRSGSILGAFFASRPALPARKVPCLACGDEVAPVQTAKLPCTHRMCHSCLKRIFELSLSDPAHMPPRCCTEQHINLKHVDILFDDDFKKKWNRKFKEYNTKNKIYCPRKGCDEWIQPKYIKMEKGKKVGRCPKCKTDVCGICSQKAHKARDCPKDPATKALVEVAAQEGWRQCYSCSSMVELREGCNHMTCRCTAEFCMMCGLKWKSCDCPWFGFDQAGVVGDPVRHQMAADRRREQERIDGEIARRIAALDFQAGNGRHFDLFGNGNAANHHVDQNFIQQAREVLTGNYQQADQTARGLLNGLFTGRENTRMPGEFPDEDEIVQEERRTPRRHRHRGQDPAASQEALDAARAELENARHGTAPRRGVRLQNIFDRREMTPAEREQERRIRAWADRYQSL